MRNLEQRIAEINRRSEEIIKKRKRRRKQLLAACIPVVLGIGLACSFGLPERATEDGVAPGTPESFVGGVQENKGENSQCAYVRMEVLGDGLSRVYTEQSKIASVAENLQTYTRKQSELTDTTLDEATAPDGQYQMATDTRGETNYSTSQGYTVVFVTAQGESIRYLLHEDMLYEGDDQRPYMLTAKQAEELRNLLGISDP